MTYYEACVSAYCFEREYIVESDELGLIFCSAELDDLRQLSFSVPHFFISKMGVGGVYVSWVIRRIELTCIKQNRNWCMGSTILESLVIISRELEVGVPVGAILA